MEKELDEALDTAMGSGLRDERSPIKLDAMIAKYPDGVTVVGFEMCQGKKGDYPIFAIAEENVYFSGGGDLKLLTERWLEAAEGDVGAINESLARRGLKFKIWKTTTKNGNKYTKVARVREAVKDEGNKISG